MKRAAGGIDQSGDLLWAEDARQSSRPLRIGRQAQVPGSPERLEVEESQRRQTLAHRIVGELAIAKQVRLIAPNLVRSESAGRLLEVACKILHHAEIAASGARGIVATLEFLEHLLA